VNAKFADVVDLYASPFRCTRHNFGPRSGRPTMLFVAAGVISALMLISVAAVAFFAMGNAVMF
jgi:hypothetical protein